MKYEHMYYNSLCFSCDYSNEPRWWRSSAHRINIDKQSLKNYTLLTNVIIVQLPKSRVR